QLPISWKNERLSERPVCSCFRLALTAVFAGMVQIKRAREAKRMRAELEHLLTRIPKLQEVIEAMHRCKATHVESVPVIRKKTVWAGLVEVFDITDHPKANAAMRGAFQKERRRAL